MEFYERMKELQLSQENKSRMRGDRLQALWNRICEDEQKSLARNQELIKEFDRVQGHMKKLSARTKKLQQARQQYMDYISMHYPQWLASKQQQQQQQIQHQERVSEQRELSTPRLTVQPATPSSKESVHSFQQQQQENIRDSRHESKESTPRDSARGHQDQHSNEPSPLKHQRSPRPDPELEVEETEIPVIVAQAASAPRMTTPTSSNSKKNVVSEQMTNMKASVSHSQPDFHDNSRFEPIEAPIEPAIARVRSASQSPRITDNRQSGLNSPTIRRLAVRDGDEEVLIPTLQLGSTDGTGVTVGTGTLSDQMSELLGSVQNQTPRVTGSLSGSKEIVADEVVLQQTRPQQEEEKEEQEEEQEQESNLEPLNLDGLCSVMKAVADDFSVSFNPEAFYRCETMDSATRRKLVYCANNGDNLDHFDPNAMSMVLLEELPGVCRSLPGGSMVRDEVLGDISFMVKEVVFRAKLTTDGRQLWDALYDHMRQAIIHGVLSPREIASMIGPSLLRPRSSNKEKIVTVLTSLLQAQNDSQMSDISSTATSVNTSPSKTSLKSPSKTSLDQSPRKTKESPNKSSQNSSPVKLTTTQSSMGATTASTSSMSTFKPAANPISPRDKSTSDDDYYDKSTPRYKPDFSLTGSAAYKNMLGFSKTQPTHSVDDDEDDLDDMLAIPRAPVVIPSYNMDSDNDPSIVSAPSPVNMTDKLMDTPDIAPKARLSTSQRGNVGHSTSGSGGLKTSGGSSGSQQANNVIQRLMSESEFSDTEVSIPMGGNGNGDHRDEKSEADDFDGFFD